MSSGLFPIETPESGTQTPSGNAPAKDTGSKNNEIWGTFALNNMKKDKIVAQFKSDYTVDIKNITTGKSEKGNYSISGSAVTMTGSALAGSFTLETTSYAGTSYYILKSADVSKTLAMAKITYDQFASVY